MKPATAQTNSRLDYNRASNTLQKDPSSRLRQFVVCSVQKIHPPCHLRSMLLEEPDGNGHKRLCTASDLVKHSLNIFKKRPKQSTVPREIDCPQEHCKKHPRSDIFPGHFLPLLAQGGQGGPAIKTSTGTVRSSSLIWVMSPLSPNLMPSRLPSKAISASDRLDKMSQLLVNL